MCRKGGIQEKRELEWSNAGRKEGMGRGKGGNDMSKKGKDECSTVKEGCRKGEMQEKGCRKGGRQEQRDFRKEGDTEAGIQERRR